MNWSQNSSCLFNLQQTLPQLIQVGTNEFIIPPTFGCILWHFSCCLWFYKASTFHKWKLILSKQMLVSIFYILKKYGYDLVGEGLEREMRNEITGRGTAWAEIRSQVRAVSRRKGVSKENLLYNKTLIENILTRSPNKILTYHRLDDKMVSFLSFCKNLW